METTIRINDELFCKHNGKRLILENNCFQIIKDVNDKNIVEIVADDLKIKGDLISLNFEDQQYAGLLKTHPQYLEFHIKTQFLEDIKFRIGIQLPNRVI